MGGGRGRGRGFEEVKGTGRERQRATCRHGRIRKQGRIDAQGAARCWPQGHESGLGPVGRAGCLRGCLSRVEFTKFVYITSFRFWEKNGVIQGECPSSKRISSARTEGACPLRNSNVTKDS